MCLTPDLPSQPKPGKQPTDSARSAEEDQRRRSLGFARTILTGPRGALSPAATAGKTLLGG